MAKHEGVDIVANGQRLHKKFQPIVELVQESQIPFNIRNSFIDGDYSGFVDSWNI